MSGPTLKNAIADRDQQLAAAREELDTLLAGLALRDEEVLFVTDYDKARQTPAEMEAPYRSAWKMRGIVQRLVELVNPYQVHIVSGSGSRKLPHEN